MGDVKHLRVLVALLVGFALVACVRKTPAPEGTLVYQGPIELGVAKGNSLPGTDIRYLGITEKGAQLSIEGQTTIKRKGDSLDWEGSPTEGVDLDYSLRILWFDERSLHVGGLVKLVVHEVAPQASIISVSTPMVYRIPVAYTVARGELIPGTLIEYAGKEEKGARLKGVDGYPYRKIADSILWEGKLRDNVFLKLELRVIFYDQGSLRVGGLATLWVVS